MFPPTRKRTLAQRTAGALRLARSFLLLEDDYEVDWEVDENELGQSAHPHRLPLPGRVGGGHLSARRPGQPSPQRHVCVSPVRAAVPPRHASRTQKARPSLETHGSSGTSDDSRIPPGR
jgi:hypothetical protein